MLRAQRGLSVVEFMVGVAVGLLVIGGATKLFVDYLSSNRRLLVETRVNQDLRAAADLIARDLRRGGYWRNAAAGISSDPKVAPVPNPYATVSYDGSTGTLSYAYDKDGDNSFTAGSTEDFGVRRGTVGGVGVVQLRTAGGWQTITDPATIAIPAGGVNIAPPVTRTVELFDQCPCLLDLRCAAADFALGGAYFATRPRMTIREITLTLSGSAPNTAITRTLTETVRVRNDLVEGVCPNP
jgi:prepilin peptidase dependent protein B